MTDQVEQLRQQLAISEQRYRDVIDNIREVYYQLDAEGLLTFLSPTWQKLNGHKPEACLGQSLWNFLDESHRPQLQQAFLDIAPSGSEHAGEYRLRTAAGRLRWVEISIRPMSDGSAGYSGSLNDITTRKKNLLLDDMFRQLWEMVLHGTDADVIMDRLAPWLADIFTCQIVLVRKSSEPEHLSLNTHGIDIPQDRIQALPAMPHADQVLRMEEFHPAWRALIEEYGIQSAFAAPLGSGVERLGRIVYLDKSPEAFPEETLVLMEAVAERVCALLQTAKDQQWLHLISSALKTTANAIFIARADGIIEWGNAALFRLTGYDREEIVGSTPRLFDSGAHPSAFWESLWEALHNGDVWQHEVINRGKNGELYTVRQTVTPIRNAEDKLTHFISVQEDISQIKKTEEQLRYNATHDQLTNLPNRMLMLEHLNYAIHAAQRGNELVGILFIDLDHFKIINDSLGHLAGDDLLCQVTSRLSACLRVGDTLARQGGDEFVVVLTGIHSPLHAAVVAKKMLDSLRPPITLGRHELTISCSVGISLYPPDGEDAETLLKNSDTAMYNAKENGRNNFRFYVPEMNTRVVKRMELENDLRHALTENQFELHYQPKVEIATGRIVGVEALIRWQHPQRGMVSPTEFIPVAEETGLIVSIGEWVLLSACRQLSDWLEAGLPELTMAVNVSARQFRHEIILFTVKQALIETGIDPQLLELEITESLMLEHVATNTAILQKLHDMGPRLALDDFGTGFSSLSYLRRLPFDSLKIDRTFVQDIGIEAEDTEIVVSIINLAHNLGIKAIAEGVETEAQREFLRKYGCDFEQGFLFSKPLPAEEMAALLRQSMETSS